VKVCPDAAVVGLSLYQSCVQTLVPPPAFVSDVYVLLWLSLTETVVDPPAAQYQLTSTTIIVAPVVETPFVVPPDMLPAAVAWLTNVQYAAPLIVTVPLFAVTLRLSVTRSAPAHALDGVDAVKLSVPPDAVKLVIVEDPEHVVCHVAVEIEVGAVPP
jgi:hypothetical protein